jgi:hypothetical protein
MATEINTRILPHDLEAERAVAKGKPGLKAIDTWWNGLWFRSRLEARWAVFFDYLDIKYEYEKEGYDLGDGIWYLPDFWLPDQECFVEIKGDFIGATQRNREIRKDTFAKCGRLAAASGYPVFAAVTGFGNVRAGWLCRRLAARQGHDCRIHWPPLHLRFTGRRSWSFWWCWQRAERGGYELRDDVRDEFAASILMAYRVARAIRFGSKHWTDMVRRNACGQRPTKPLARGGENSISVPGKPL